MGVWGRAFFAIVWARDGLVLITHCSEKQEHFLDWLFSEWVRQTSVEIVMCNWLVPPLHRRKHLSTSPSWASYESMNECPELKPNRLSFGCQAGAAPRWVAVRGKQSSPPLPFWPLAPWAEMTSYICKTQARSFCLRMPRAVTVSPVAVCLPHFPHCLSYKSAMHQICRAHKSQQGQCNSEVKDTGGGKMRTISISCKFGKVSAAEMLVTRNFIF